MPVAFAGIQAIRLALASLPRIETVAIDSQVLVFAAALTALTGVLFGLGPGAGGDAY